MIFDATIVLIAISDLIVSTFIDLNASDAFTVMRLWRLVRSRRAVLGQAITVFGALSSFVDAFSEFL